MRTAFSPRHFAGLLSVAGALVASTLSAQGRAGAAAPDSTTAARLAAERREDPRPAPARKAGEGEGPFTRLIIRGVHLIDGYGSPPRGPVDVVVEGNKIVEIVGVGYPNVKINETRRPGGAVKELNANGMYIMPGLVDLHVHQGTQEKAPDSEYYNKLWLANGITTVRGVPFASFDYSVKERARAAKNEIAAPRYVVYQRPGTGWGRGVPRTPELAREWVRWAKENGADGLKLGAERADLMAAYIDEAKKNGMGTTAHLQQGGVGQMNAMMAAKLGLGAVTHFYGIFESMYENTQIQPWPVNSNLQDEQTRFGQVARQWSLVKPGSEKWNNFLKVLKENEVTLDPTMTTYLTGRDVMARMHAPWHAKYTIPTQWSFYTPSRTTHGSYFYEWTTEDEVAWRRFYQVWMQFVNDYKNMGGRVSASSDAGFIYNTPGFSTIEELELLQEAGFTPGEAIRAGTLHAAETIFLPMKKHIEYGVLEPGMNADIIVVDANPFKNMKVLYGTGWFRLNDSTGKVENYGGIKWTIKDGIIYDAKKLLEDIEKMGDEQRKKKAT